MHTLDRYCVPGFICEFRPSSARHAGPVATALPGSAVWSVGRTTDSMGWKDCTRDFEEGDHNSIDGLRINGGQFRHWVDALGN